MVNKEELLRLLYLMVKVRRVEECLVDIFSQGKIPGFIHVGIGQEAVSAGVCSCLRERDVVFTTHRGHGQALAKGIDLNRFMAEIYGRRDGFCKGKAGSMHIASREAGVAGSNGIVGGGLPIAVGNAFAAQYRNEDRVTVCFFGDGASNEGTFHESLNLAALWNLPVVFCCENNGWAQFTPQKVYMKLQNISKRAESYGMIGVTVDGDDVLMVREEAEKAVERAIRGMGPTLLECKTHRWLGHYVGDPQKYRTTEEVEEVRKFDPIIRFQKYLLENKHVDRQYLDGLEAGIKMEIEEALAFAENSPIAPAEELFTDVYA
ncbi:MAG: thiamine pyrophosphate-dependent dehydrogenase E1 component subunit alpha [Desulfomonilaceae bacterium]|nr:thiamine pyrophosphate-dependent dehydrogenase E1 component subunit alpha [Desulfomonilaceae bacterium]